MQPDHLQWSIQSGIDDAVAFNASLSPGLCPQKILKLNPPTGARAWYLTEEGRRLLDYEKMALHPSYHQGVHFPIPDDLQTAAVIHLCSGYLSVAERFKLSDGCKRRIMADQLAEGRMHFTVFGDTAFGADVALIVEDLPWLVVKLTGLPLSFSGAELIHLKNQKSFGRVIGSEPLFRKLSALAIQGEAKSLTQTMDL